MVRPHRNVSSASSDTSKASVDYGKINPEMKEIASPLSDIMDLDQNQMVILSGPFPSEDSKLNIMIARKIPQGYTVIAKPILGAPAAPLLLRQEDLTKIDPSKCSPVFPSAPKPTEISNATGEKTNNPMVMMWNAEYPDGRLVPLRQPSPPVYFQTPN